MDNQTKLLPKQNKELLDERRLRIELVEELKEIKNRLNIIADNVYNWESWKDTVEHLLYV